MAVKKTRIFSRPEGAPMSAATDITDLPKSEQDRISNVNAIAGTQLKNERLAMDVETAKNRALGTETAPAPLNQPTTAPQQPINPKPSSEIPPISQIESEQKLNVSQPPGILPGLQKTLGLPRQMGVGEAVSGVFKTGAQIFDALNSFVQKKKPIDISTSEDSFNKALSGVVDVKTAAKTGVLDPAQARVSMELAIAALNRLESANKGLGKANLRYWLGGGAATESNIIIYRQQLEILRQELNAQTLQQAMVQQRQQAIANYGSQP